MDKIQDETYHMRMYYLQVAKSQNDKKKERVVATQLMYAIATAASNLLQWLGPHWLRSLSISTVIPAAAQAPANVIVEVTCFHDRKNVRDKTHTQEVVIQGPPVYPTKHYDLY